MKKLALAVLPFLLSAAVCAGVKQVNVQGLLTNSAGTPLTGNQTVTFRLYDVSTGGAALWQDTLVVSLSSGQFNVPLGANASLDSLPFNKAYYLGLQVAGDASEMSPRQALGSSPYALGSVGDFNVKGKLGVGISTPGAKMEIKADTDGVDTLVIRPGTNGKYITFQPENGLNRALWGYWTGAGWGQIYQAGPMYFEQTATFGGSLGVGTSAPVATVHVIGSLTATGGKNFTIGHPLDSSKLLVHSSVESPERGLIYRGKASLQEGVAVIALPDYFEALVMAGDRTVQLTCVNGYSPLYVDGEVQNGRFTVRTAAGGSPTQAFYWMVQGKRGDPESLADPFALVIDKPTETLTRTDWNNMSVKRREQHERLYKVRLVEEDAEKRP